MATVENPLAQIPQDQFKNIEVGIRRLAFAEAKSLAQVYARADKLAYPGISQFGRQLDQILDRTGVDGTLAFNGVVSTNPDFWRAEREITTIDPSLPYLVAMLAVLSDDRITASRMLSLAQATLPLTPAIRRIYARPEGSLRYQDKILLWGLPRPEKIQTAEGCENAAAIMRLRIAAWPKRTELLHGLFDLESRRMKLLMTNPAELEQRLDAQVKLTSDDGAFVRKQDPILAEALPGSVRDWLNKTTLAQQWTRWMDDSDPAERADIEKSVAAYEAAGRDDLAWLTWRHWRVVNGVTNETEQRRWQAWSRTLLGAEAADRLIAQTAANPRAGTASLPVPFEQGNEVWSGDQGMHPLLAIKLERTLATIDAQMAFVREGSRQMAILRLQRAESLLSIGAPAAARREYERAEKVVGQKVAGPMLAFILAAEEQHDEAAAIFLETLKDPRAKALRRPYADCLFKAGHYEAARIEYRRCVQDFPDDEYRAIMAEVAARRGGGRETELLRQMRGRLLPGSWTESGISYLLGEITADELMVRAREGTPYAVIQHECEGAFWIAQVALAEGRTAEAVQWLHRCLATGFTTFIEYAAAKAELKRLQPEEKDKGKESAPRDSRRSMAA